jgi:hypothetical protein
MSCNDHIWFLRGQHPAQEPMYLAINMDKDIFQFTYDGQEYRFWAWKGDYLNLVYCIIDIYINTSSASPCIFNGKSVEASDTVILTSHVNPLF